MVDRRGKPVNINRQMQKNKIYFVNFSSEAMKMEGCEREMKKTDATTQHNTHKNVGKKI